MEYLQIWDRTREVQLLGNQPDKICWKWTPDKIFSSASAYSAFFIGQHPIEGQNYFAKPVHRPNANSSSGWCYTRDAGLQLGVNDMVCRTMTPVRYVPNRRKLLIIFWLHVHSRGKSGSRSCARSVGIRRCFMYQLIFSQLGGPRPGNKFLRPIGAALTLSLFSFAG